MKKPEQAVFDDGSKLPLIDQFYTVQGEGYHMGKAAYFIRIGGCDIGCSWCDTKYSWNFNFHDFTAVEDIVTKALQNKAKAVVVTGGEPSLYNLETLCKLLKENDIETFVETSGAYPLRGIWDWICLSPKKQNPPKPQIFKRANELKVIISKPEDLAWAEENAIKVNPSCKLYLQPEWSKYESIIGDIIDFVKNNQKWQVSLQAHKFMHIP
ncbi:MAG: 7-carboxy-7-deazaguanine synthase QueE [Bacteroidales bacterium]|nr:7-carboxy-7-deazaguanine synthase QueE [Bacteroidales bacterium]